MKALKPLAKAIPSVIKQLNKVFGVDTIIYPPNTNKTIGIRNDNITFKDEPIFEGRSLVPFILDKRIESFSAIADPFSSDENIMYFDINNKFPRFSKVIIKKNNTSTSYLIDDIRTISDDERDFYFEYILVPFNKNIDDSISMETDADEINNEIEMIDENIIDEIPDTVAKSTNEKEYTYNPI